MFKKFFVLYNFLATGHRFISESNAKSNHPLPSLQISKQKTSDITDVFPDATISATAFARKALMTWCYETLLFVGLILFIAAIGPK